MAARLHPDALELALLTFMLDRHPAPVHGDDLARAFRDVDWEPGIESLRSDGLLHVDGELYLAARAAVRAMELMG